MGLFPTPDEQIPIQVIIDKVQEQNYSSQDFMNLIFGLISNKMNKLAIDIDRLNHEHKHISLQLDEEMKVNDILRKLNESVFTQSVPSQGHFKIP
jgi:hypothetical protein